jgi:hypothetical protein
MERMGSWMMGVLAATATSAAESDTATGSVFGRQLLHDNPQSGVLAVVGVGLLVLSVFGKRSRDP